MADLDGYALCPRCGGTILTPTRGGAPWDMPLSEGEAKMTDEVQETLFGGSLEIFDWWRPLWEGMPEFVQEDLTPDSTLTVQFARPQDRRQFLVMLGEEEGRQKSIWFPSQGYLDQTEKAALPRVVPAGRYPIYVISKGRADNLLTVNALNRLGLKHTLVVEPTEEKLYRDATGARRFTTVAVLPFADLGQGSIPARNWVWDHAAAQGHSRHWILDDNIDGFYRLNRNLKRRIIDENPFSPVETFCERYRNVALGGLQYEFFAPRREQVPPLRLNTRVYSCILINHVLPFRWRGRYNEDTDLSLRALKAGWCTVLFNAYLCKKMPTMKMAGGNTDELYAADGRRLMAESLAEQHPDVARVSEKWGRVQHHVDYTPFQSNKLEPVIDVTAEGGA